MRGHPLGSGSDSLLYARRQLEALGDNAHEVGKSQVGPATAQFGGEVEFWRWMRLTDPHTKGKGADKGGSSASMELEAVIEDDGNGEATLIRKLWS